MMYVIKLSQFKMLYICIRIVYHYYSCYALSIVIRITEYYFLSHKGTSSTKTRHQFDDVVVNGPNVYATAVKHPPFMCTTPQAGHRLDLLSCRAKLLNIDMMFTPYA